MKYGEAEIWLREQLANNYENEEASTIASLAIERLTGFSRLERLAKNNEVLEPMQLKTLEKMAERLGQHEPLQYVVNEAHFAGLTLFVDKNVLIPRPETEELLQWIIDDVRAAGKNVFEQKKR